MHGVPCFSHPNPRAYIASPLFTPPQLEIIEAVTALLHAEGYDTYSPYRDGIVLTPNAPPEQLKEVFESNKRAIIACDVMVAIVDDKDTGTIWEFGGANMRETPVISFSSVTKRRNVMLSQGVLAHVESYDELRDVLRRSRAFLAFGHKATLDLMIEEADVRRDFKSRYTFRGETQ